MQLPKKETIKESKEVEKEESIMADNPTVVTTPYPTIMSGGSDDDSFRAALISHSGASVERNQDSQFSANRDLKLTADVGVNRKEIVENRFESVKDSKRDALQQAYNHAEVKAELAALRAEMQAQTIATLRADIAETRAAAREASQISLLTRLVTKLGA